MDRLISEHTIEEAIAKLTEKKRFEFPSEQWYLDMAIDALKAISSTEPIILKSDGTLVVTTPLFRGVKRVLVEHGTQGTIYYADAEPSDKWIPVTYRQMTDEEKKEYAERTEYDEEDFDTILNCQLPEDGETVLITDRLGNVEVDTFINDCGECYFECNCDMEDVIAWMPLPKPYEPQERSDKE